MIKLYENIKYFRKLNKWTQEELAKRMGYTNRSMIAKIETGKIDLSQSKIIEFANVFGIAPGDLMGWDGWDESYSPPEDTPTFVVKNFDKIILTEEEKAMIIQFRNAPEEDKLAIKRLLMYSQMSRKEV